LTDASLGARTDTEVAKRVNSLLTYVEQVVRLDERPVIRLAEYKLPNGHVFIVHQNDLASLPGVTHDAVDEDGPIWLKIERLRRGAPPSPPEDVAIWLEISPDPDRDPILKDSILVTLSDDERLKLIEAGAARSDDCEISPHAAPNGVSRWDVRLRLEDRPEIEVAARDWIGTSWLSWALVERPVRRTILLYQRFFEVAQLAEMGGGGQPFEIVWGIGLARWRIDAHEIDLPLIERLVEIQIDETQGATIIVRPRRAAPIVNLHPFESLNVEGVLLARDSARRAIQLLEDEQDLSPFQPAAYEPILRACQSQLDPEGVYLPDVTPLAADKPLPAATNRLTVSDRWVIFGRRQSDNFLLSDIDRLKKSVEKAAQDGKLPGSCRTLVLGREKSDGSRPAVLPTQLGAISANEGLLESRDPTELFFPKPFNDEQVDIVRKLEEADGVVVQGPPGTGKTHTISNIICHAMATGQRVLVVSHAEPALAVLRDQLPESIRPLAISITTSERAGVRQVETAVRQLQSILQTIREPDQIRAIREAEDRIIGLRKRLEAVDHEIADFAHRQLAPSLGGKRAAELAEAVVAAADRHAWFADRPSTSSAEAAPAQSEIEALRSARAKLGAWLGYLGVVLPSLDDLPDGETVAQWHDDLLRAQAHGEAARRDPTLRIRLDNPNAVDSALGTADALNELMTMQARARLKPWLAGLTDRAVNMSAPNGILAVVKTFMDEATPVVEARRAYLTRPVEIPGNFDGPDAIALIAKLAEGGKAYGLLAFKEKALRTVVEAIRLQGKAPASPADYAFVRDHLTWRERVDQLCVRWRPLAEEIGAPQVSTPRELDDLVADLRLALVEAPTATARVSTRAQTFFPGGLSPQALWFEPARAQAIEDSLRNATASAKLSAVRNEIGRLTEIFGEESKQIGKIAREFLRHALGLGQLTPNKAGDLWTGIRKRIGIIRQSVADFDAVARVTDAIRDGGAPKWAIRLRTEPPTGTQDSLLPADWRDAWDWAAASVHLRKIDDRQELGRLAEERVRLDHDIKRTFEALVRDRTYWSLQRSMTPRLKAALQMVATAVSQIGRGTGVRAQRARRDAQRAMADCYDGIPCWIMPTWRVAEQLPGEIGTFDLVILDEASQSDIRELPALLRGKKILVVGDDRQVSPTASFIDNDKIERLERNWLRDHPYKILLLPGSSIYNFAKVMFPEGFVMLREHFRCVEPIIRFSSDFYPEPLIPLRVPAAHERLDPPLIDIYIPDGRRAGAKQNPREAKIIVEEIRRMVEDETIARIHAANRWRTIGVISLIGAQQAALINRMILEALGEEVVLRHRIACGDSATFQGNERDVIFLSMVADPKSRTALTAPLYEQRFNVAMSRARDRLVLVRSVHEDELTNPRDLKVRVIRHFKDPMASAKPPPGELEAKCESDFERAVLRRLIERGHRVTPQVGAQGYRIDLVVEGKSGQRLAIECDGDKYHGPERWAEDMKRQRILERVGWRFWRCWASSFTLDPAACPTSFRCSSEWASNPRGATVPGRASRATSSFHPRPRPLLRMRPIRQGT
jgi:very-short-patch-repair endonuclease